VGLLARIRDRDITAGRGHNGRARARAGDDREAPVPFLLALLGWTPRDAVGFAIGTDRLILSLQEAGAPASCGLEVYVAWMGVQAYPAAVALARKLREHDLSVELPAQEMKFGKSLNLADRLGARFAVILGDDELAAGQFTVKRLADGDQRKLSEAELLEYLMKSRTA